MMIASRTLALWAAAFACAAAVCPAVNAAKKDVAAPAASFGLATAMSDPMSPVNPYNAGSDPITMPGDARMVVFPYSRDQIYRIMTAPLKNTTIELAKGERVTTDPATLGTCCTHERVAGRFPVVDRPLNGGRGQLRILGGVQIAHLFGRKGRTGIDEVHAVVDELANQTGDGNGHGAPQLSRERRSVPEDFPATTGVAEAGAADADADWSSSSLSASSSSSPSLLALD
ncbi:hypothetical protein QF000_007912 [Paraburkholderia atlantica]